MPISTYVKPNSNTQPSRWSYIKSKRGSITLNMNKNKTSKPAFNRKQKNISIAKMNLPPEYKEEG